MESVVNLGRIAVYLGVAFALVMFGLVVWYYFHSAKLDAAEEATTDAAGTDSGAHA